MSNIIYFPGTQPEQKQETSVIKTAELLKNEKCCIELRSDKEVFGRDLTDHYNDPAFYNKSVRGLKKAWAALQNDFTAETKMYDAIGILRLNGIKCHSWCMMD